MTNQMAGLFNGGLRFLDGRGRRFGLPFAARLEKWRIEPRHGNKAYLVSRRFRSIGIGIGNGMTESGFVGVRVPVDDHNAFSHPRTF
jgi:hypothetical protein